MFVTTEMFDKLIDQARGTVENYYDELREHDHLCDRYRRGLANNSELLKSMRHIRELRKIVEERNPGINL